jgi:hypothetical protein
MTVSTIDYNKAVDCLQDFVGDGSFWEAYAELHEIPKYKAVWTAEHRLKAEAFHQLMNDLEKLHL